MAEKKNENDCWRNGNEHFGSVALFFWSLPAGICVSTRLIQLHTRTRPTPPQHENVIEITHVCTSTLSTGERITSCTTTYTRTYTYTRRTSTKPVGPTVQHHSKSRKTHFGQNSEKQIKFTLQFLITNFCNFFPFLPCLALSPYSPIHFTVWTSKLAHSCVLWAQLRCALWRDDEKNTRNRNGKSDGQWMCVQCALWSTLCCHVVLTERRMSNKMQIFMSASVCLVFAPSAGISIEFADCVCVVERFHSVVKLVIIIVVVLVVVHRAPDGVMREWRPDCKLQCVFVPNQIILRIFVGTFRFSCQSLCFCNVCVLCAIDFFLFVYLKITRTMATATTTGTASIHEYETHIQWNSPRQRRPKKSNRRTNWKWKAEKRDKIHNSERLCQCTNSQMNCIFFPSLARSPSISLSSPLCELPPTNTSLKAWPRIFIGYVPDMHRSKSSSSSFSFSFVRSHSVQVFYR